MTARCPDAWDSDNPAGSEGPPLVSREVAVPLIGRWTDGGVPEGAPCAGGRPPRGSPGSLLVRPGCDPDAGYTMRLHLRSTVLAAALIAPAAVITACGQSDSAASPHAAKAATAGAARAATAARPTLARELRRVVAAGS